VASSGRLTTYLGTAPGVGKTYAMLSEAQNRAAAGERVVVGWLERQEQRPDTVSQVGDLEWLSPALVSYRGHDFPDLDVPAVLAANPEVVVIDELAHSLPDGRRKRWMDVADLLGEGIDVITSVNVANLVSARDYVARITGAGATESVPDEMVRSGEVVLVDLPADVLRRRVADGQIFSAEQVGGALSEYFRISNLEALSELGQAWMAERIDEIALDLLARRGLATSDSRPVVIAGVSDSEWGEAVIRRATQLACEEDAELVVVHARISDGSAHPHQDRLAHYQALTEKLGGSYIDVEGESPARALAEQAEARVASRVVVARHRSRLAELVRKSVASQLRRLEPDIPVVEVHERV
jgi:two-component system, OmpR family, sensor histidine kinase KdpD